MRNVFVFIGSVVFALGVGTVIVGLYFFAIGSLYTIEEQTGNVLLSVVSMGVAMVSGMAMISSGFYMYERYEKRWWIK